MYNGTQAKEKPNAEVKSFSFSLTTSRTQKPKNNKKKLKIVKWKCGKKRKNEPRVRLFLIFFGKLDDE